MAASPCFKMTNTFCSLLSATATTCKWMKIKLQSTSIYAAGALKSQSILLSQTPLNAPRRNHCSVCQSSFCFTVIDLFTRCGKKEMNQELKNRQGKVAKRCKAKKVKSVSVQEMMEFSVMLHSCSRNASNTPSTSRLDQYMTLNLVSVSWWWVQQLIINPNIYSAATEN